MSFGLGINGAIGGAAQGASIGSAIPGLGTTVGGIIGGGLGLLGGLFGGGSSTKDQEKLMEKVNYREKIADLIGIRVLHLFKEEWEDIHEYIINRWMLITPKPKANIRAGDHKELLNNFEEKGCEIVVHPFGYRSVHYHINTGILREIS